MGSPMPDQPMGDPSTERAEPAGRLNLPSKTSIRRLAPAPQVVNAKRPVLMARIHWLIFGQTAFYMPFFHLF